MDFSLDAEQDAITAAVTTIVTRHAGPSRLRALGGAAPRYDHELDAHLSTAGFLDVVEPAQCNRVDAALVQEVISGALGCVASAARLLVGPSIPAELRGPIAVVPLGYRGPSRFAADAVHLLVLGVDEVWLIDVDEAPEPVESRFGWPVGRLVDHAGGGTRLDVAAADVRSWTQVALAVELVGTMRFALDLTVRHVTERHQFGRAIGSFQAIQHGLAECAVLVDGARWLALEAAWNATTSSAALALSHAIDAADVVFTRAHQYSGAIGFTCEYDLHLATMRLPALRAEALGHGHPAALASGLLWGA